MRFLSFACIISALPTMEGYVFLIDTDDADYQMKKFSRFICYTNESDSAIAFIRNLKIPVNSPSSKVEYRGILKSAWGNGKYDCNLFKNCDGWNIDDFDKVNSSEKSMEREFQEYPPILDRRWNELEMKYLPTLGKNNLNIYSTYVDNCTDFEEVTTYLTLQTTVAHINFFSKDDVGVRIVLDDLKKQQRVVRIGKDETTLIWESLNPGRTYLNNGTKWTLLKLQHQFGEDINTFSLQLSVDREVVFNLDDISAPELAIAECFVFYSIPEEIPASLIRLNKYNVLKASSVESEISTDIQIWSKQPICLDVTYYSGGEARKGLEITMSDKKSGVILKSGYFDASLMTNWATKRFRTNDLEIGSYTISIRPESEWTVIGDVRFCVQGAELAEITTDSVDGCQSLRRGGILSVNDNGLTTLEADALCSIVENARKENFNGRYPTNEGKSKSADRTCSGVRFCSNSGTCNCLSGHVSDSDEKKCQSSCGTTNKYGFICKYGANKGKCERNEFNIHTGFCKRGCVDPDLMPPECTKKRLQFNFAPIVSDVGAHGAWINLTSMIQDLRESYESESLALIESVDIQLQIMVNEKLKTWSNWVTVQTMLNFSGPAIFFLDNLRPAFKYKVVALIREKGNPRPDQNFKVASFQTLPCTALDKKNIKLQIGKGFIVRFKVLVKDPNMCHVKRIVLKSEPSDGNADPQQQLQEGAESQTFDSIVIFSDDGRSLVFDKIAYAFSAKYTQKVNVQDAKIKSANYSETAAKTLG